MERRASCQNLISKKSYWQLLMGVIGNVKLDGRSFHSQNSTATSRAKGGSYKRREHNMQR